MKKALLVLMIFVFACSADKAGDTQSVNAPAAVDLKAADNAADALSGDIPAAINLKDAWNVKTQKAVIFDHTLHRKENKCTDCHADDEGGKFTPPGEIKGSNDQNAAHKFCWTTCHAEKKVSVGKICTKCHTK